MDVAKIFEPLANYDSQPLSIAEKESDFVAIMNIYVCILRCPLEICARSASDMLQGT